MKKRIKTVIKIEGINDSISPENLTTSFFRDFWNCFGSFSKLIAFQKLRQISVSVFISHSTISFFNLHYCGNIKIKYIACNRQITGEFVVYLLLFKFIGYVRSRAQIFGKNIITLAATFQLHTCGSLFCFCVKKNVHFFLLTSWFFEWFWKKLCECAKHPSDTIHGLCSLSWLFLCLGLRDLLLKLIN